MNICVFGASSDRLDPAYYEAARALGAMMAREGHRLVFGGGREGLMGACARGALENGGKPLGVAPRFFDEPGILMKEECDFVFTESMAARKGRMEDEADAFIALPGGIGTYEEFFEVLTLRQLARHQKPIALLNTLGYFEPLAELLRATAEKRFMSGRVLSLFAVCPTPEAALRHVVTEKPRATEDPALSLYSR